MRRPILIAVGLLTVIASISPDLAIARFQDPRKAVFSVDTTTDPDSPPPPNTTLSFIGFKLVNFKDFSIQDNGHGVRVAYASAEVADRLISWANKLGHELKCSGVVGFPGAQYAIAENRPNEIVIQKVGQCRPLD